MRQRPPVAPGSYVAIYGTLLAGNGKSVGFTSLPLPTTLNGTSSHPLRSADAPTLCQRVSDPRADSGRPYEYYVSASSYNGGHFFYAGAFCAGAVDGDGITAGIYTVNESGSGAGIVTEALNGQLNSTSDPCACGRFPGAVHGPRFGAESNGTTGTGCWLTGADYDSFYYDAYRNGYHWRS